MCRGGDLWTGGAVTRPVLRRGSRGPAVRELQTLLKAAGYYQTYNLDGLYGPGTENSVRDLQEETARLVVDAICGPQTWGALDGILVTTPEEPEPDPEPSIDVTDQTWLGWLRLVELVTTTPVVYGPGRGGYMPPETGFEGSWIIRNKSGNYPGGKPLGVKGAFVCSTWTNFVAGYLLRYDERYTPTGGMPALSMVLESSDDLHPVPGLPGAQYRGYGPYTHKIAPHIRDLPLATLYDMRAQLPTFVIAGQSSRRRGWWNYHHCAVFVADHRQVGSPLYRIAADGYRGRSGFSKTPMVYRKIDPDYVARHDSRHRLRCYGLDLSQVEHKPIQPVALEGSL